MDWLDYREKLGIGFCDEEKFTYFKVRLFNSLSSILNDNRLYDFINEEEYCAFCRITGTPINYDVLNRSYGITGKELFEECLYVLEAHKKDFRSFISYYIAFVNSVNITGHHVFNRKEYADFAINILVESHIPVDLIEDGDEYYIFPKGAKELDITLVSEPLDWLKDYPKTRKTFCIALKQYSEGVYIRDVADNFRKALEEFFQEFLGNAKNLANNIAEIFKYLNNNNAESELSSMVKSLLNSYDTLNNKIAKHNDRVDKMFLEFLMYQTGIFIRMLIVIKKNEKSS